VLPGHPGDAAYLGRLVMHRLGGPTCLAGLGQATADVELVCMRFTNKKTKKLKGLSFLVLYEADIVLKFWLS
jgi:hypothetical protein